MTSRIDEKQLSRKEFIKTAGKTVAGVAMLGSVGAILSACAEKKPEVAPAAPVALAAEISKPEWPFKYVKMDAAKAEKLAYDAYKTGAG